MIRCILPKGTQSYFFAAILLFFSPLRTGLLYDIIGIKEH